MRRQVRPFVTEVRATSRRARDGGFTTTRPDASREVEQPRGTFNGSFIDGGDDSYEAALKAADALFSAPRGPQSKTEAAESKPAPAARGAGETRSNAEAAFSSAKTQEALLPGQVGDTPEAGGRILRAIEPIAADPFVALEAERAPKRRGRKPGSKNKPKVSVTAPLSQVPAMAAQAPRARTPEASLGVSATRAEAIIALLPDASTSAAPALPIRRRQALPAGKAKPRDHFAWVRTKLRPGEKWKRRLPKVAW